MLSASFLPLITKPTRVTNQTATLIDNIFCNVVPLPESGIILSDISDHYPIFSRSSYNSNKKIISSQSFRKVTTNNLARLNESLEDADWTEVYNTHDTNTAYNIFMTSFMSQLDRHIPIVNKRTN